MVRQILTATLLLAVSAPARAQAPSPEHAAAIPVREVTAGGPASTTSQGAQHASPAAPADTPTGKQEATADAPPSGALVCIFRPRHDCDYTIHSDLHLGGGRGRGLVGPLGDLSLLHLQASLGVLFAVDESSIQIGPAVSITGYIDPQTGHAQPTFAASLFLRVWLGEWVTLDGALGPSLIFDYDWYVVGAGGVGELSLTFHGHVGPYFQFHVLSGSQGAETFVVGGVKGSLVAWGALFAVLARGLGPASLRR